jgi:hypothetical protein
MVVNGLSPFWIVKVIGVVHGPGEAQFGCQIRGVEYQVTFEVLKNDFVIALPPDSPRWLTLQTIPPVFIATSYSFRGRGFHDLRDEVGQRGKRDISLLLHCR